MTQSLDPHRIILGNEPLGQFGKRMGRVGDMLVISAPSEMVDKQWQTGCVRLIDVGTLKDAPFISNAPSRRTCGADTADHFGWSLGSDTCGNLIIGARSMQHEAGAIYTIGNQGRIKKISGPLMKARLGEELVIVPWGNCPSMLIAASPSASKPDSPRTGMLRFYCANQSGECDTFLVHPFAMHIQLSI